MGQAGVGGGHPVAVVEEVERRPQVLGHHVDLALLEGGRDHLAGAELDHQLDREAVLAQGLAVQLAEGLALGEVEGGELDGGPPRVLRRRRRRSRSQPASRARTRRATTVRGPPRGWLDACLVLLSRVFAQVTLLSMEPTAGRPPSAWASRRPAGPSGVASGPAPASVGRGPAAAARPEPQRPAVADRRRGRPAAVGGDGGQPAHRRPGPRRRPRGGRVVRRDAHRPAHRRHADGARARLALDDAGPVLVDGGRAGRPAPVPAPVRVPRRHPGRDRPSPASSPTCSPSPGRWAW